MSFGDENRAGGIDNDFVAFSFSKRLGKVSAPAITAPGWHMSARCGYAGARNRAPLGSAAHAWYGSTI